MLCLGYRRLANAISAVSVPYEACTANLRLNPGIQMMMQGLLLTPVKGDTTIVSVGDNKLLVVTPVTSIIVSRSTQMPLMAPRRNMVMAFINRTLDTEDAYTISTEFAESGSFSGNGCIEYPPCRDVRYVRAIIPFR